MGRPDGFVASFRGARTTGPFVSLRTCQRVVQVWRGVPREHGASRPCREEEMAAPSTETRHVDDLVHPLWLPDANLPLDGIRQRSLDPPLHSSWYVSRARDLVVRLVGFRPRVETCRLPRHRALRHRALLPTHRHANATPVPPIHVLSSCHLRVVHPHSHQPQHHPLDCFVARSSPPPPVARIVLLSGFG